MGIGQLVFEQILIGGDRNFGYLLGDRESKTAVLIDPAFVPEVLVKRAIQQELKVTHILNTHGHHVSCQTNAGEREPLMGNCRTPQKAGQAVFDLPQLFLRGADSGQDDVELSRRLR